MEDEQIVNLYWARSESAVSETARKYGRMLQSLSEAILHCREDAEECVNDSYVRAWNSMPENRPTYLGAYMSKITRNLSLNCLEKRRTAKRQGEDLVFDELSECIPDPETSEEWLANEELRQLLNAFLASLDEQRRAIFLRRYFYNDSTESIASVLGMKDAAVRSVLHRLRLALKKRLEEAGMK